ncbi:hypothetical protein [Vogesella fluminis]|uniref:Uncharacterized protein n=1 Tax=Vogesella fluminis TaxID=1069161 RepID=A0ABQ3HA05_9NEIS|nr:hypothetical protein [Vogesella fluminis]GHD76940.1 hypothetical protein GCM10011419_16990 [Vogesella fluminis]
MKLKSISIVLLFAPCLVIGKEKKIDIQANLLDACKAKIEAILQKKGERDFSIIDKERSPDSLIFTAMRLSSSSIKTDRERLKYYRNSIKNGPAPYLNGSYAYLTMVGSSRLVSIYDCRWRSDFAGITSIDEGGFLIAD